MDEAEVEAIEAALDEQSVEALWPDHVAVWNAFLVASTQWRISVGMTGMVVVGFDYAGVRAGLDCAGIAITPEQFADLRVMEIAACAVMNGDA